MAQILSDGTQLIPAGETPAGQLQFVDQNGRLITLQNGRYIVSSESVTGNAVQFNSVINNLKSRGDEESARLLQDLQAQFRLSIPSQDALDIRPLNDFLGGGREAAGEYFVPDRKLIDDRYKLIEEQARASKDLLVGQQREDLGAFEGIQDRSFARILEQAQGKFSGQGTYTSGIRNKYVAERTEDNTDTVESRRREFSQFLNREDLSYAQTIARSDLDRRRDVLNVDRAEEQKAQQIAQQKYQEELIKSESRLQGFQDFIIQKLSG